MLPTRAVSLVAILLMILALPGTAAAQSPCEYDGSGAMSDNCFILRAPRGLQSVIAGNHGLTIHRDLAANDLDVVIVEGPTNVLPETTLANLKADADVFSVEAVGLESVSETAPEAAFDPGSMAALNSLTTTGTYGGPETQYFTASAWQGYLGQDAVGLIELDLVRDPAVQETFGVGVVAVIDTGVDPEHALLQGALVPGYDFLLDQAGIPSEWESLNAAERDQTKQDLQNSGDQTYAVIVEGLATSVDESQVADIIVDQTYAVIVESQNLPSAFGHGTMVAGVVRLVAPNAKIMPIRAFDGNGLASLADIVEAIYWAVDNGADVINMSFSVPEHSKALARAVKYARRHNVTCVTSAGNAGNSQLTYPAAYGEVIGVGSTDLQDQPSSFSSFGDDIVFMTAPGEAVITLFPGNLYAAAWGTSFSAPFVSGTVALLHGLEPDGTVDSIKLRLAKGDLEDSADVIDPSSTDWGAGRLDVEGSYNLEHDLPDVD